LSKLHAQYLPPRMHDYVEGQTKLLKVPLHCRPHSAAHAIAVHRSSQNFTNRESHARAVAIEPLPVKSRDVSRKVFLPFLVDHLEIRVFQQA
jgi:hypothetical protein